MNKDNLPIENWSQEGREEYIEKNRVVVELAIQEALEVFKADIVSKAFGSQEKAVTKIIELFVSPQFSLECVSCKNIDLFTQLKFWVKYKTAGNVVTNAKIITNETCNKQNEVRATNELCLDKISESMELFNKCVAPDVIKYWMKANKKLLNELAINENIDLASNAYDIENSVSNTQETRYKVDAAFRYLFLYLGIGKKLDTANKYVNKYLTKGDNKPQYVSLERETHHDKHLVRLCIIKIIDKFYDIHKKSDVSDVLTYSLLKVIAKKAVLDVYEINSNNPDKKIIEEYTDKLKSFRQRPSFIKEATL
tara:strand:+ start:9332 stop:10258 length:927 start_codon:yes stop_codon:yes gene_type:complete